MDAAPPAALALRDEGHAPPEPHLHHPPLPRNPRAPPYEAAPAGISLNRAAAPWRISSLSTARREEERGRRRGRETGELEAARGGAEVAAPLDCHITAGLQARPLDGGTPVRGRCEDGAVQAKVADAPKPEVVALDPCSFAAHRDATNPPLPLKQVSPSSSPDGCCGGL
jgi:hypothetical protein